MYDSRTMLFRSITRHAGWIIFSCVMPQAWQNSFVGWSHTLHLLSTSSFEEHVLQDCFCIHMMCIVGLKTMLKLA